MKPLIWTVPLVAVLGCSPPGEAEIPQDLQGRWGLTANDCDPTRDDAKGLMAVGPTDLRFYEARADLTRVTRRTARGLTAEFVFRGEGQVWTRQITLTSREAGMILLRQDQGEGASGATYRYFNCEAV